MDKYLVKNLVVGYVAADADKRLDVLKIVATVLDFNQVTVALRLYSDRDTVAHIVLVGGAPENWPGRFVEFLVAGELVRPDRSSSSTQRCRHRGSTRHWTRSVTGASIRGFSGE